MERLFMAECPCCHQSFACHYDEMRHAKIKLFCPSCRHRFAPEEAASLDERWDEAQPGGTARTG
jgi:hypothetical protein